MRLTRDSGRGAAVLVLLLTLATGVLAMTRGYGSSVAAGTGVTSWVMPASVAVRLGDLPPQEPIAVVDLKAARQEYEHAQICLRSDHPVTGVRVALSDLAGPGAVDWKDNVSWRQVGYVNCKPLPADYSEWLKYSAEPGWWPDPLLEVEDFDLEPEVTQPIWVTVYVPAGTAPGSYQGTVRVLSDQGPIAEVPVKLEVWPLDLPNPGRFDTVFSFYYPYNAGPNWQDMMTKIYGEFTPELRRAYFELLGQHRIPADDLYLDLGSPRSVADYKLMMRFGGKRFNLIYAADAAEKIPAMLDSIAPTIEELGREGMVEHAYVYGFDEKPKEMEPVIRQVFGAVKERWPKMHTMAVLNWEPPVDIPVDTWVILYNEHDPQAAARWRAAGKEYWWYHCCGPIDPQMNTFVEKPRINGRLMMWLAAREQVSGWLYWTVNNWEGDRHVVTREGKGPRTDFDPETWQHDNGDGNFIYPGPRGPLSSTRLENLTDGIEDWELFAQLREKARSSGEPDPVSDLTGRLVRSSSDRTADPALLESARREAARMLVELNQQKQPPERQ